MNATKISLDNFNSNQQVNLIMLGFAVTTGKLPFIEIEHYEEVIKERLRDADSNIKALHLGLEKGKEIIISSN
jgi:Pyruvate/2-oxoacid:ferredoxin oxidoreductase gamma subunit